MSVKLGLLYAYRNPAYERIAWARMYRDEIDLICYAETLGYDNVWMSEHHCVDDGYMSSPLTIATANAARTEPRYTRESMQLFAAEVAPRLRAP